MAKKGDYRMNNIKIICDSLSDLDKEYLQQYDIDVVPLTLILNGKEYRDSIDIKPEEFYKILSKYEKVVCTD